ncbi:MAG TPA: decarboxylating NADP(+)-dependent phosphogluconate dehydrogenase [Fibrobacteria bacterium]|nr:decarboxylating NADP(+)-dependent phosphogluconate dehydrogenase [Fibrobacteria bacterium]
MAQADIGLIGLAVMGENLVLNMESRGYTVAVFNRTVAKVDELVEGRGKGKKLVPARSLSELVTSLKKPRKIMMMVKAGPAVDDLIEQLVPLLDKGDILIDGGNSYFPDSVRRTKSLEERGFRFLGVGVSGGEEGALKGPSIMPGGSTSAWPELKPIFQSIAAKVGPKNDIPCCDWVGADGAGHYVKMIHNGIEYGDMQLICEAYSMMKTLLKMTPPEIGQVFAEWNKGPLDSYLIEITRDIFTKKDPETGKYLVDVILDKAGQKGTGKWTSQNAMDLGIPIPTMMEAVVARSLSAMKDERVAASAKLPAPEVAFDLDRAKFLPAIHDALYASKLMSYAQGFQLLRAAAKAYSWDLNYGQIAMLWRGGCIIRARFLEEINKAFLAEPNLANLILAPYFTDVIRKSQANWRLAVSEASKNGLAIPAFSSALAYYDSYRGASLPANLLQAQRDYFGAHTYERVDKPGIFHTEWLQP